jgi:DNA invertase Pin-like site-specific DNA recombinase
MSSAEPLSLSSHGVRGHLAPPEAAACGARGTALGLGDWRSPKTRQRHLERQALVYVRQSTPHQIVEHTESLARQYALRDRAAAFGWPSERVLLIDDDLGLSGSGTDQRRGFQRLLAEVAQDRVGLVLALEMSRLARNSRDWHNLFDLCAVRDVLLADEDGVYDPSDINDRLILGMKGIMSEMETHVMKMRMERGRRNKAQRGELFHAVPWGYVLLPDGAIALDPDEQVRGTVQRLFDAFQTLRSAFAVVRDLRQHDVKLPMRHRNGQLVWRIATRTIVTTILHHPLYAGAYAWGRRQTQTGIDPEGRMTRTRKKRTLADWVVLLHDRAPAYITWEQYLANQQQLLQNLRRSAAKGTPGGGSALLGGLVYCGHCGRKMHVTYQSIRNGRYSCSRTRFLPTEEACGGLPAQGLDDLVAQQVLQALTPAGVELSLSALEHASDQRRQQDAQLRQNLERAAYEAQRAERQYQAVEPENRLVARTLEARWQAALQQQCATQEALDRFRREKPIELTAAERRLYEELSRDIPALWHAPETTARHRQEIVRCVIERIEIDLDAAEQRVGVLIRWAGGAESRHSLRRTFFSYEHLDDYDTLCARVVELRSAGWRAPRIAAQLDAEGFRTPRQRGKFTASIVRQLFRRAVPRVDVQADTAPRAPKWSADALARRLKIPVKKLKDWVRRGWVQALERPFGGMWILHADKRQLKTLERRVALCRKGQHYPADLGDDAV